MQAVPSRPVPEQPIVILSPTLRRARAAMAVLRGQWKASPLMAAALGRLPATAFQRVLLCPRGIDLEEDLDFLRRARDRILWPTTDGDLAGAIGGLRGLHLPVSLGAKAHRGRTDLKSALLLEGRVTPRRALAALSSPARHWVVESPLAVDLSDRHLLELARAGVHWSALESVRVAALLASPRLARAREKWRRLLPRGTKAVVMAREP